ncbi:hypothetical protein F8388_011798 [Cannabis sativa]|uniref:Retrotransposon gag domain-containing protein n=1 Tax=Cannabis sativa TaxID=3483 RepID=A0A7J6FJK4_CANSA|nr:hypothetical protein F8388_011798 [Cannabis sativa]
MGGRTMHVDLQIITRIQTYSSPLSTQSSANNLNLFNPPVTVTVPAINGSGSSSSSASQSVFGPVPSQSEVQTAISLFQMRQSGCPQDSTLITPMDVDSRSCKLGKTLRKSICTLKRKQVLALRYYRKTTSKDSTADDRVDPMNEPQLDVDDRTKLENPHYVHQEEMGKFLARHEAFPIKIALRRAPMEEQMKSNTTPRRNIAIKAPSHKNGNNGMGRMDRFLRDVTGMVRQNFKVTLGNNAGPKDLREFINRRTSTQGDTLETSTSLGAVIPPEMELLIVDHEYIFPTTLLDSAHEWYWKFKQASITSWEQFRKEFCKVFSAERIQPVYANQLADIKQGKDEFIKDYIERFIREANQASTKGDEGKFVAISTRIVYRSPLWHNIHKNPINNLQEFLDLADKYMKLDDAIMKEEKGINHPTTTKASRSTSNLKIMGAMERRGMPQYWSKTAR